MGLVEECAAGQASLQRLGVPALFAGLPVARFVGGEATGGGRNRPAHTLMHLLASLVNVFLNRSGDGPTVVTHFSDR